VYKLKLLKKVIISLILLSATNISFAEEKKYDYTVEFLMGKYSTAKNEMLVKIPVKYCVGGKEIYAHKEAFEPVKNMIEAAQKDGIKLQIISGVRTFYHQKSIWDRKWNKIYETGETNEIAIMKEILKFSSMPGSSRHHWGTDFDFNSLEDSYFQSGKGKKEYEWLVNNGKKFGFCQVYKKENGKGYSEEKWHWSYMILSEEILKQYLKKVKYSDFEGFNGSQNGNKLRVIEDYVSTINRN
jgi:zinc D-Ala-D-Ala carboxypeptidase